MEHRREGWVLGGALVALALAACTSEPSASPPTDPPTSPPDERPIEDAPDCPAVAARTVDALQRYVDGFAGVSPERIGSTAGRRQEDLDAAASAFRERVDELDCAPGAVRDHLAEELERLRAEGPVAESVAATFRSGLLADGDPSDPGAVETTVESPEELLSALATAGTGSTITLSPGEYRVERPLVAFRAVTIAGAGEGATTIVSSAEQAAVLSLAEGELALTDLTLRHEGDAPASGVAVRTGAARLDGVTVAGARAGPDDAGGFGLVLAADAAGEGRRHEVLDSELRDNEGGGVLVAGESAPVIRDVRIAGDGACGVCYADRGGGELEESEVRGHAVGVRVGDDAAPALTGVTVRDAEVGLGLTGDGDPRVRGSRLLGNDTGVEIAGSGSPWLERGEIRESTDVGLRLAGEATPDVVDTEVRGATDIAVTVFERARPRIRGGALRTTGEAGVVFRGQGAGSLTDVTVAGARLGVQVGGDATPRLEALAVGPAEDAAVVVTGAAGGRIDDVTCEDGAGGVLLLLEQATPDLGDALGCEVVDERS